MPVEIIIASQALTQPENSILRFLHVHEQSQPVADSRLILAASRDEIHATLRKFASPRFTVPAQMAILDAGFFVNVGTLTDAENEYRDIWLIQVYGQSTSLKLYEETGRLHTADFFMRDQKGMRDILRNSAAKALWIELERKDPGDLLRRIVVNP